MQRLGNVAGVSVQKPLSCWSQVALFTLLCLAAGESSAATTIATTTTATTTASIAMKGVWSVEGGTRAPVTVEPITINLENREVCGAKLVCSRRPKSWNKVFLASTEDLTQYNTLEFKARVDGDPKAPRSFTIYLLDKKGNWSSTRFSKHARDLGNGWWQFSWDTRNQPDVLRGFVAEDFTRLGFNYDFGSTEEGQTVTITIVDICLIKGRSVVSGDPQLFARWNAWVSAYRPDYGDSTALLQPPTVGRLATPLAVAREGRSSAKVVLPTQASPPLVMAARELSHWLEAVTGAAIPITHPESAPPASLGDSDTRLFLGRAAAEGRFDEDLQWLEGSDGFAVRARGGDVFIFGATDKGTLNGVFAFLENNTDVIWPRPNPEMGAVHGLNPNMAIQWADGRERPATRLRGWGTNLGNRPSHDIWQARNRVNYPAGGVTDKANAEARRIYGNYLEYGGGHNLHAFVPPDRRDFYPTIAGAKPEKLNVWKHQLCLTHPELPAVYIENLLRYLREKAPPAIDCMNVKIEDNWGVCTCSRCLAPITLPDGSRLSSDDPAFRSTQFFQFLNQVTRGVNQVYPDLALGTYAYFFTATAPKIAVDPHIRVYFCPYVRKDQRSPLSAPINDHWWRQLNQWSRLTPNLVMREYYGIMNGFRPLAETVAFDLQSYQPLAVEQYTSELQPDQEMIWSDGKLRGAASEWDLMAMDYWIITRLYWNPAQDVERLRKYYLRRSFREAAPAMERFFGLIRSTWFRQSIPSDFEEPEQLMSSLVVQTGHESALRQHLAEAAAAVHHPVSRMMIDQIHERFEQWLRWSKDREARKRETQITPALALRYGWTPNNDWLRNDCWAAATVIHQNGQTLPAVRATLDAGRASEGMLRNPFIKIDAAEAQKMQWLEMTIRPTPRTAGLKLPYPTLLALDAAGQRRQAPPDAYVVREDGTVRVRWNWTAPTRSADTFDAATFKMFALSMPKQALSSLSGAAGADRQAVYHLYQIQFTGDEGN